MIDWEDSIEYQIVSDAPEVRAAIAQAKLQARQGVSSSQLLQVADQVATPFTAGVSSITIAKIAQPLYAKLGLKTGKERNELLPLRPGRALACILCALARQRNEVVDIQQADDACTLTALLPADLRGMDGKLTISVRRHQQGTLVTAQALIEGQWYDWGKCQRGLDALFASFRQAA